MSKDRTGRSLRWRVWWGLFGLAGLGVGVWLFGRRRRSPGAAGGDAT